MRACGECLNWVPEASPVGATHAAMGATRRARCALPICAARRMATGAAATAEEGVAARQGDRGGRRQGRQRRVDQVWAHDIPRLRGLSGRGLAEDGTGLELLAFATRDAIYTLFVHVEKDTTAAMREYEQSVKIAR